MKYKVNDFGKTLTSKPLLDMIDQADNLNRSARYMEAVALYYDILARLEPDYRYDICECLRKIGDCYYLKKMFDEARIAYTEYLNYCTTNAGVYAVLGYICYYFDVELAIKYYSKAITLNPKDLSSISSKFLSMLKSNQYNQSQLKKIIERDIEYAKNALMENESVYSHDIEKLKNKKKLNIGYLSSDFCNHAMMQFVLPLLENHNCDKFNFTLFSTYTENEDYVTEQLKNLKMNWQNCKGLSNKQLAERIYSENIDILIDLGGYTHNSCFSMLYKPAPIQMQYLGFLNTMGCSEVDYIITDEYTIPEDMAKYYTEKPLYLGTNMQRFLFDINDTKWPEITESPFKKNGYITFGSFNCVSKINDFTIKLWAKILKNIPNSKLLIYRYQMTDMVMEKLFKKFKQLGLDESRVILDNTPLDVPHFSKYLEVDVALDPIPFNGLTITFELIAMGVPVLSFLGNSMQSRGASRINNALGLDELIATNENEYIKNAQKLAKNPDKIEYYRNNLRKILSESYLVNDYKGFAEHIEDAYQKAWDDYIAK